MSRSRRPRRALVLGAGGVLGAAWSIGALNALVDIEGFDPREADVIVGTSAGSVLAALLGAGLTPRELADHQRGLPLPHRMTELWRREQAVSSKSLMV